MSNPDEIRRDIERTRAELSDNVNALGDSAKPANIVRDKVEDVKEGARDLKSRIFGSPDDPYDNGRVGDAVGSAKDSVQGAVDSAKDTVGDVKDKALGLVHDAGDAVSDAPQQVRAKAQGNPLAAGLVAVGLGALLGGLLPSSRLERQAATQVKDAAQPVVDHVKDLANEAKDNLQPLAQEAVASLKDTAQSAAENVKSDATLAKDEVAEHAKSAAESVKADAQFAAEDTKVDVQQAKDEVQGNTY